MQLRSQDTRSLLARPHYSVNPGYVPTPTSHFTSTHTHTQCHPDIMIPGLYMLEAIIHQSPYMLTPTYPHPVTKPHSHLTDTHTHPQCDPDLKIPGLYMLDAIIRQSRHQYGEELDIYSYRFTKNMDVTIRNVIRHCNEDENVGCDLDGLFLLLLLLLYNNYINIIINTTLYSVVFIIIFI